MINNKMVEEIKEFDALLHRGPLNEIEKTLAKEVQKFWKEKTFSDVDIHCGMDGGVIQAHCLVLASLSPVFKSVLRPIYDNYTDNEKAVLIIPGVHSSLLTNFLNSVYTGSACEVSIDKELQFLKFTAELIHETVETFEPSEPPEKQNRLKETVFELDKKTNEKYGKRNNTCIWEYYSTVDKKLATCDDCSEAVVVTAWGDLSELTSHLKTHHPNLFKELESKVIIPARQLRFNPLVHARRRSVLLRGLGLRNCLRFTCGHGVRAPRGFRRWRSVRFLPPAARARPRCELRPAAPCALRLRYAPQPAHGGYLQRRQ